MKKLISTAALVLSSTLLLSACGDDEEKTPAPETSQSASPEKTDDPPAEEEESDFDTAGLQELTGDGYSLYVPEDWQEADSGDAQSFLDLNYANSDATLSMNMVIVPETPVGSDAEIEKLITDELETAGFTNVQFPGVAEVDGEEGPIATAETAIGEETFHTYQVLIIKDGQNHVLTVGGFDKDEVADQAEEIVKSWTWS